MADIEDFDLDETTRQAWCEFTERLTEVLSVMDASADLTISVAGEEHPEDSPSIRFSASPDGVIQATLSHVQSSRLEEAGWQPDGDVWVTRRGEDRLQELAELTTSAMADIVGVLHPIFLEPDQLAEVLTPRGGGSTPPTPGQYGIVMPANQAQLDAVVDEELGRLFGRPALRNAQGDVAIRVGSTVVFCRSTPDFRELVLFSALVHDVSGRSRACEVLNDLNVQVRYCRFALHQDRVFVQVSVPAQPFVPAHLRQALESISHVADGIDNELAHKLGGHTTYPTTG
ncbi:hypothetical protein EII34_08225 [Arachnia propionica]|uniref:YbjN domain-containing protein n=1 Tax=Arachnia propionica TaxID=1750 RepID=A0A3P1T6B0_9ACTN|nr:hypothetical protein [Arachnia propionica]MDO5083465.1 hypothetical protein [Arachnia propionica]RRD04904.1 hypothetical protein EII34_08225 [Arachnia propionica]